MRKEGCRAQVSGDMIKASAKGVCTRRSATRTSRSHQGRRKGLPKKCSRNSKRRAVCTWWEIIFARNVVGWSSSRHSFDMDGEGGCLQLPFMVRVEGRKSTRLSVAASTGLFAFDIQETPHAWQHRLSRAWGERFIDRQRSQMITEICQPVNSESREVVSRRSYHCRETGATKPPHIYLPRYLPR